MSVFWTHAKSFGRDELGVTSLEYALLGSLIAVVIAAAVGTVGTRVTALFQSVVDAFP